MEQSPEKPSASFQELSSSGVTNNQLSGIKLGQHMCIPRARRSAVPKGPSHTLLPRLVMWAPSAQHRPKSQTPRKYSAQNHTVVQAQ